MKKKENAKEPQVLVVDEKDRPKGEMDKMEAHRKGVLHRAFSVLLFDGQGRLLLQQRASGKYHSGGLWSNTCCSHPLPGESVEEAAARRLREEMGIDAPLDKLFSTRYFLEVGNGMIEHELNHVLFGISDQEPDPDSEEAMDRHSVTREEVDQELQSCPERFTEWFKVIWQEFAEYERAVEKEG